ncbi:MAG TPA: 3-hydroxyacyl-CoA dehydrogenase NAD-binding domain-containing protein [Gemmatimonadaceae bacterium]|jgi:3-hydroxybutyryl-CoA dehydrogenase
MKITRDSRIGVVGAGAMGSGIAQVAATYGHEVILHDTSSDSLERATKGIGTSLARFVEKGRITADEAARIEKRVQTVGGDGSDSSALDAFAECALIIEAVIENLEAKQDLFSRLESFLVEPAILATNTSSLSVTAIARACAQPERVIGIHFFNPPTVLPLVEIVPGYVTSADATAAAREIINAWGKTTVLALDTPGFIVNRIARPFYGEALRIYEEGIASMATIDWAMRDIGGFKMGPFELMDFIGNDVNFAATKAVYEGTFNDPRYKPTITQQRLFEAGFLGKKTGRGYYDYREGAEQPEPDRDEELGTEIFSRILAMLINEAADAVLFRIATPRDVDLAMTRGVNYPKGLLAWGEELGLHTVLARLEALYNNYGEDRYRPSALLKRMVSERKSFFAD